MQLDDLVVVLRQMMSRPEAEFGCLIVPGKRAWLGFKRFLRNRAPAHSPGRTGPVARLFASAMGQQDIEVHGLDPRARAARVIVEADYRMKLVGMGLEEGVPGVRSYLASMKVPVGQAPPAMSILRWWFTLNYDAVLAARDRSAFAVRGQGVKVLDENERLSKAGQRIHTGQSDALTRQFAQSFTEHFEALCRKYPIYGELRNSSTWRWSARSSAKRVWRRGQTGT